MTIRPYKCHEFALKKVATICRQYKPKIYINNASFENIGRWLDLEMENNVLKKELLGTAENILKFQLNLKT